MSQKYNFEHRFSPQKKSSYSPSLTGSVAPPPPRPPLKILAKPVLLTYRRGVVRQPTGWLLCLIQELGVTWRQKNEQQMKSFIAKRVKRHFFTFLK